uniref:Uncharacterized protein n=1 Tax=Oryza rufipogon TaxID=4529 RepID=A0A0E0Q3C3_ORYRU
MKGSEGKGTESSGFNRRRSASVWGPHGLIWAVRFGRPVGLTGEPIADAGQQAAGSEIVMAAATPGRLMSGRLLSPSSSGKAMHAWPASGCTCSTGNNSIQAARNESRQEQR